MKLILSKLKQFVNQFRFLTILSILIIMNLLSSCSIERLFPGKVANGLARLTVANLGLMLAGIKQEGHLDLDCEILSEKTSTSFLRNGSPGDTGKIVWTFNRCTFNFKNGTIIFDGNNNPLGTLSGIVTVSGKKIISGYLTSNENFPVIPEGPESYAIQFSSVEFNNFKAELSGVDEHLTVIEGNLAFNVIMHLGSSKSLGLCSLIIPNLTFKNIIYNPNHKLEGTRVSLPGLWNDFEVLVRTSDFEAQQNTFEENTNTLAGTISIWDLSKINLSTDNLGLDPNFKTAIFSEELEKITDLELPVTYNCPVKKFLASQAARLLVQNLGNIAYIFGTDNICGPISTWYPQWITNNSWIILSPSCKYINDTPLEIFTDCAQTKTYIKGDVTVSALTILKGKRPPPWLKIYRDTPNNISFNFKNITLKNFVSYDLKPDETLPRMQLLIKKGELYGDIDPLFAEDKNNPCNFTTPTPIATFDNIRLKNAETTLQLNLKGVISPKDLMLDFNIDISDAKLFAMNGLYQGSGNLLSGSLNINSKKYDFKDLPLNPFYDQQKFDDIYNCMAEPVPSQKSKKIDEHCYEK